MLTQLRNIEVGAIVSNRSLVFEKDIIWVLLDKQKEADGYYKTALLHSDGSVGSYLFPSSAEFCVEEVP